jgi:hypothetical protein
MSTETLERIDSWRTEAGHDNPAGPLFTTRYAEADLTASIARDTHVSICSGSNTIACC